MQRHAMIAPLILGLVACVGEFSAASSVLNPVETAPRAERPDNRPAPVFHFLADDMAQSTGLRLLSPMQYADAVADLSGVSVNPSRLPAPLQHYNLANDAAQQSLRDPAHMIELLRLATKVAAEADIDTVFDCTASPCTETELESLIARASGSPLADASDYYIEYLSAHEDAVFGPRLAKRLMLQLVLLSPHFLYRVEAGDSTGALLPRELADRLSYFMWGASADAALVASAREDGLSDYTGHVKRVAADARTRARIVEFTMQWLGADDVDLRAKDAIGEVPADVLMHMRAEVEMLIGTVLFDRREGLAALFTAETTFLNKTLADLYGIAGPTGVELQEVSLIGTQRRGILTTPLLLAAHSKESGRSPMQRGSFLLNQLMCHSFPPEAGTPTLSLGAAKPGASFRDLFAPLESGGGCSTCHRVLNAGFAFDIFDPLGRRFATSEVGSDETYGSFDLPPYEAITFPDTVAATEGFAQHPAVGRCYVSQAYRFALGRLPGVEDAPRIKQLLRDFRNNDQDVVGLWQAIATAPEFRRTLKQQGL